MRFAKLNDGVLVAAPLSIEMNGFIILNPSEATLRNLGYKSVIVESFENYASLLNPIPAYRQDEKNIYVSYIEGSQEVSITAELWRKAAYEVEADGYLLAYYGYLAEGKTEQAEEQKALYLEAKARIRERYAD